MAVTDRMTRHLRRDEVAALIAQAVLIVATLALLATISWTTPPERGSFFALVLIGVAAGAALWVRRGESLVLTLTDAVLVLTGVGVIAANQPTSPLGDGDAGPRSLAAAEQFLGVGPGGVAPTPWVIVGFIWIVAGSAGLVLRRSRSGR